MNANYLTVQQLKDILWDVDFTGVADTAVSGMISRASGWVDNFTNAQYGWERETFTQQEYSSGTGCHTDANNNLVVPLLKRPLAATTDVTRFTIALGGFASDLVLTNAGLSVLGSPAPGYSILYPSTMLYSTGTLLGDQKLSSLRSYNYFVRLDYTAGYSTFPPDLQEAVALLVRDRMALRYNPTGASQQSQGSMSQSFAGGGVSQDSRFVSQAKYLLSSYVKVT